MFYNADVDSTSTPTENSSSSGGDTDYSGKIQKDLKHSTSDSGQRSLKMKPKHGGQNRLQVTQHFGSFYLRMGAVGKVGSLIS